MKNLMKKMTVPALSLAICGFALGSSLTTVGCNNTKRRLVPVTTAGTPPPPPGTTPPPAGVTYVQVERLGRPAVNEGLVQTNAFLNAFNSISPDQDLAVLTDPANAAFLAEVIGNLQAVDGLDGNDDVVDGDIVQAFLPDVMRIDTTQSIAPNASAYDAGALVVGTVVRPISGRKLEDDVIDITLSVISGVVVGGAAISDNVDYRDATLNDGAGQVDHDLLNGQTAPLGTATFPFLAPAN